jgi:predicted nucleic acid-binding protein
MTEDMRQLVAEDPSIATWWTTGVECTSALARRARSGALDPTRATDAYEALALLARSWIEIPPTARVRDAARRLVRLHDLAAADAFQLAAAFEAADDQPESLQLVTLDTRLALAARREGFRTLP